MALNSQYIYVCLLTVFCTVITYFILNGGVHLGDQNMYKGINMRNVTQISGQQDPERKKNETKKCKSCLGNVPDCIIQFGPGRTATTLQFEILCLCMAILHEDEIHSVGCAYNRKKTLKYNVIKTHEISKFLAIIPSDSWIFMTSKEDLSPRQKSHLKLSKSKIKNKNITIPYIADVDLVSKRGHFIAYEYQTIFGLSDEKMQHVVEYVRYWDILRLCCGKQMSADWRNHLSPSQNYKQHHDPHSSTYPACEMYNISKVEQLLLRTYAFQKFGHVDSLRDVIGKPSTLDGNLNGSYCERCNANVAKRHLKINQNCV